MPTVYYKAHIPCAYGCEECGQETDLGMSGEDGSFGIQIRVQGYGDISSKDGYGAPVLLENRHGTPYLVVWADINREDPTHTINLAGAAEALREKPRLKPWERKETN